MEGFVDVGGYRTWFRVVGESSPGRHPLLCLHGGPGSTHNYFAPLERLARDGRTVVLYDQLGCGRSDRPEDVTWSLDLFLAELTALREELRLERVHLLGTSWGGMLALEHVLSGAEIAGLVLSSTLADAAEWQAEALRLRNELPAEVVAVLDEHAHAGTYDDPELAQAERVFDARHFYRGVRRPELERMRAERNRDVYRAMWGPNEWTMTGALAGWDVRARLHEISAPTLIVRGRYDLCTPAVAATLLRGIPHAREVVFEHSSHTPVLEETERYVEAVASFLRDVDGSG